ncbi:MAG: purine nucleoside phosphorylase [Candidatus Hydrogenedentota bacterium]
MTSFAPIAVVSGSGLDLTPLLDTVVDVRPFAAFPNVRACTALGHSGTFTIGLMDSYQVILQSGRLHFYEGLSYDQVTASIDVLHQYGVQKVIMTNAVGGLVPAMHPGALVAIDTIRTWPYTQWPNRPNEILLDFTLSGCDHEGTYFWVHGPSYETRAEIRVLQQLGGHVVGMSTAPEAMRCHELGMGAALVSCVTNNCCEPMELTHDHVVKTAKQASDRLVTLLREAIPRQMLGLGSRP